MQRKHQRVHLTEVPGAAEGKNGYFAAMATVHADLVGSIHYHCSCLYMWTCWEPIHDGHLDSPVLEPAMADPAVEEGMAAVDDSLTQHLQVIGSAYQLKDQDWNSCHAYLSRDLEKSARVGVTESHSYRNHHWCNYSLRCHCDYDYYCY